MVSLQDSLRSSTHKGNTRVMHASRRNSASVEIKGQEELCLQDAQSRSTHMSIRWRQFKILGPTCNFLQMHLQEPEFIWVHKWQVSEETHLILLRLLREISTRRTTSKSGTGKDFLLCYLRSPGKSTFKHLCRQTPLWRVIMRKMPQEPKRLRWPQKKGTLSNQPNSCASHPLYF